MTAQCTIYGPATAVDGTYTLVATGVPAGTELVAIGIPVHSAAIQAHKQISVPSYTGDDYVVSLDFAIDQATFDDWEGVGAYTPTFVSWNLSGGTLVAVASFPGGTGGWFDPADYSHGADWDWHLVHGVSPAPASSQFRAGIGDYSILASATVQDWNPGDPTSGTWGPSFSAYGSTDVPVYGGGTAPSALASSTRALLRVSPTMPAPTLTSGRPDPTLFASSSTTVEPFGVPQLLTAAAGGIPTDVTLFRDCPVEIVSWADADPMGDLLGIFRFPQITPFDTLGSGSLAWVFDGAQFTFQFVDPDDPDTVVWVAFEGLLESIDFDDDEALVITCLGANLQVRDYARAPGVDNPTYDIGEGIASNLDASPGVRPHLQLAAPVVTGGATSTTIGITAHKRGAWEHADQFISDLLSLAVEDDGDQWTLLLDRPRTPNIVKRDSTTVDWTLTLGTPGFKLRPSQDYSQTYGIVYGEGVDRAGGRYRNLHIDDDGTVFYQPLAYKDFLHPFDEDGSGGLTADDGRLDLSKRRRERFINFGEGIDRDEAQALAQQYLDRDYDPGWIATAELRIDPQEGSRHKIKAGDNLKVKYFAGSGATGTLFHVAQTEHTLDSVRLTLDTKARDRLALEEILRRQREGMTPSRALRLGRDADQVTSRKVPWDDDAGAGYYPTTRAPRFNAGSEGTQTVSLTANTWHIERIVASESDWVAIIDWYTSSSTPFALAIFDWAIGTSDLPTNPLTTASDWTVTPAQIPGCLYAIGRQGQRAGYWPGFEEDGDAATGRHYDDGGFQISHQRGTPTGSGDDSNSGSPAFLWVAQFAAATCTSHGRLRLGPT